MTAPSRGRTVAVLVLIIVALGGVIAGVAVDRMLLLPRPPHGGPPPGRPGFGPGDHGFREREREFRDRMARDLGLSDAQRVRIDSLLDRQLRGLRAIREEAEPRLDSIIDGTRRQIDSILTPAQREKARRLAPPRGPGPHGGPPPPGDWGPGGPPR